jgi:hypothetical protein
MTGASIGGLFFFFFLLNAVLALIPASIAQKKGRSFAGFWVFGLFFFVIALVVALLISDASEPDAGRTAPTRVPCPRCAELVAAGAVACRFCGMEYDQPLRPPTVKARACPTDGCSERGRPTDRRRCDVCDAATYPLKAIADTTS